MKTKKNRLTDLVSVVSSAFDWQLTSLGSGDSLVSSAKFSPKSVLELLSSNITSMLYIFSRLNMYDALTSISYFTYNVNLSTFDKKSSADVK